MTAAVPGAAEFQAAGLYDPAAPDAQARLALLEWLASHGATVPQMVEANRKGRLGPLAGDLVLRPGPRYTVAEAAARTGIHEDRLRQITLATGLAILDPYEPVYSDADLALFTNVGPSVALFGEAAMRRFMQTVGSSLARIADAAVALFLVNVEGPLLEARASELEIAQQNLRAIQAIDGLDLMMRTLLRAHFERAIRRQRQARRTLAVDTVGMTVGFVDLVGFTSASRRMTPRELGDVIDRFEETAHDVVNVRDGRVVKLIGDEVMFVAVDAAAGCDIALALVEEFGREATVTPRGGLAAGDLVFRGGDYYGPVVNFAARLAQIAVPGELLVTTEVASQAAGPALRFEPAGKRLLKGFDDPVTLLAVERG